MQTRNRFTGIAVALLTLLGAAGSAHAQGAATGANDDDPIRQQVEAANAAARAGTEAARDWRDSVPATGPGRRNDRIRDEIRGGIRNGIRDNVRAAAGAGDTARAPVEVEAPDPAANAGNAPANDTQANDATGEPEMVWERGGPRHHRNRSNLPHSGDARVSLGDNATLDAGDRADAVVSVFGSSSSAGTVAEAVVSVFGDTHVTDGEVGEASVAVMGDNYVNAPVHGPVVAVFGNVVLGPKADVGENVVVIGGRLTRDPASRISQGVQQVMTLPVGMLSGLRAWLDNCMRYLRPLAFASGLGWVWGIAFTTLALYAFLAFMFREPLERCVQTLREHPGKTVVTAILGLLLTPVLYVILCFTIIGIVFIPIATFGIFIATLFGKAAVLAWIGRGLLKFFDSDERLNGAVAVLAGGAVMLLLYTVPVLGFLVYNILGFLAFGAVIFTLLQAAKEKRANHQPPPLSPAHAVGGAGISGGPGGAAYSGGAGYSAGTGYASGAATSAFAGRATGDAGGFTAAGDPFSAGTGAASGADATSGAGYAAGTAGTSGATGYAAGADGGPGGAGPIPGSGGAGAMPPPGAMPPVNEAVTLPRAGFWIRMLALAIDTIIIGVALSLLHMHWGQGHMVLLAAYGAIMWKLKGTTVGGIVCNLKVVRLDGQPIDWSTSVVRALGCFLSTLILFLGFIWIAFDEGRQAWHDKIAGTAVVRSPQGVSLL